MPFNDLLTNQFDYYINDNQKNIIFFKKIFDILKFFQFGIITSHIYIPKLEEYNMLGG